jgi:hypothetical protein
MIPALLVLSLVAASTTLAAEPAAMGAAGATTTRSVVVAGTGTLAARGSGVARLAGSYVLAGAMDGGSLRIVGATAYTTIRVTGWTSKTRYADGTLLYRGVHGTFYIAGRTLRTTISSTAMRFVAFGHGARAPRRARSVLGQRAWPVAMVDGGRRSGLLNDGVADSIRRPFSPERGRRCVSAAPPSRIATRPQLHDARPMVRR